MSKTSTTTQADADLRIAIVDPRDLLVDTNIRTDLDLDKAFIASIRDNGVLQPVVLVRSSDGLRVRFGHRRTAGAILAERYQIPAVITASVDDADQANRIIQQLAENDHRAAVTVGDRAIAVQQLALLGVSAAQIAKRTKITRKHVDAALAITGNQDAAAIAEQTGSLLVAAWCAEVGDDDRAATTILTAYRRAGEGAARQEVERIRKNRASLDAYVAARAWVRADTPDLTVLDEEPSGRDGAVSVSDLTIEGDDHAACPFHAVVLVEAYVPDDEDDQSGDPVAVEVNGIPFTLDAYCTDWRAAGHTHHWLRTASGPQASEEAEQAIADAARHERRRVIAGNREWDAAAAVRAEYIASVCARKMMPKDAISVIARAMTATSLRFGYMDNPNTATTADATRAMLALALNSLDEQTTRNDWRRPANTPSTVVLIDADRKSVV